MDSVTSTGTELYTDICICKKLLQSHTFHTGFRVSVSENYFGKWNVGIGTTWCPQEHNIKKLEKSNTLANKYKDWTESVFWNLDNSVTASVTDFQELTRYGPATVKRTRISTLQFIYSIYQSTAWKSKNNKHQINAIPELNGQCRDSPLKHGQYEG